MALSISRSSGGLSRQLEDSLIAHFRFMSRRVCAIWSLDPLAGIPRAASHLAEI